MAGASYIQNNFKPVSYEEMVRPLLMQQELHNKIQEQESDLQALSSQWEDKLNNEKDAALKQKYSTYLQDIKTKADQLASTGLTGASKQGLYDLKTGYTTNIKPIEDAYKIRQERADEQRKLQMTDPSMFVDRNLGEEALSSFIANPNLSAKNYSGAMIEKQVATAVAPFAQKFATNPRLQHENPQYFKYIQHYGASVGTIKALKDGVIQGPMAQAIQNEIDAVMESTGMTQWGNYDSIKDRALGYAYQGASAAIGKDDVNFLQDRSYMDELQRAQLGQYNIPQETGLDPNPIPHYQIDSGTGKEIEDLRTTLYSKGKGNTKYFGKTGAVNPVKQYEDAMAAREKAFGKKGVIDIDKYNAEMDKKVYEGFPKYTPGIIVEGTRLFNRVISSPTQGDSDVKSQAANKYPTILTKSQYETLKRQGVTRDDNIKSIGNKLNTAKLKAQVSLTGYASDLTDYTPVSNDIDKQLSKGMKSMQIINPDNGQLEDGYLTKEDLEGMKDKGSDPNAKELEYIPGYRGVVVTLPDGRLAKMGFVKNENLTNWIKQGDELVQKALLEGNTALARQRAAKIQERLTQEYSHGSNQVEGSTYKAPGSPLSRE